jgi:RNA polymerase sigma-70 factor (ECF subfamily)
MSAQKSCDVFLGGLEPAAREPWSQLPGLPELLAQKLSEARAAWPLIEVAEDRFLAYVARRIPSQGSPEKILRGLVAGDLYLACACADGDARAIAAMEAHTFAEIDRALLRLRQSPSTIDEVKQRVRQHLFVGARPAIASYAGTGPLRRWVRVVAIRTFHQLREQAQGEVPVEKDLLEALPETASDPELLYIKQHYREAFGAAFATAMQSLSAPDRTLLRQHFIEGKSIDDLAVLHKVHRATAARWLAQVREAIAEKTRKLLMKELRVQRADFDSILRLIQSQLDVSIRGHLRKPD